MSSGRTFWWKRCSSIITVNSPRGKWKHISWCKNKWRDTVQRTRGECPPQFRYIWMTVCAASQTHHALWLPSKHSLAWLWQRRCYQLHRLTHFSLLPRALHSQNYETAAVTSLWQEDIFTTWGLSYMDEAGSTQKGTHSPLIVTQICTGHLYAHNCVHAGKFTGHWIMYIYTYKQKKGNVSCDIKTGKHIFCLWLGSDLCDAVISRSDKGLIVKRVIVGRIKKQKRSQEMLKTIPQRQRQQQQ